MSNPIQVNLPLTRKALDFATDQHKDQTRWDGSPYITHPIRVAQLASEYALNPLERESFQIVGLLHDVVEDTDATIEDIKFLFGEDVAKAVHLLTKQPNEEYRDFIYRLGASGNQIAIIIKLADLEDNMSDLPKGARRDKYLLAEMYLQEKL
jgi:(p)ppGpp synthase/HD superfamily hydrolase